MARQFSTAARNAMGDAYETAIGTAPVLRFYSGAMPANCATAASGTLLGSGSFASDWLTAASAGAKALIGSPTVTGAAGAGAGTNIGYFRVYDSTGTTCHDQGTVTVTGGGGDMTVDNISIATAQVATVTSFGITMGGA